MRFRVSARNAAALLFLATGGLIAMGCRPGPRSNNPFPLEPAGFAGSAACRDCHPREDQVHARSRHAKTLRKGNKKALGTLAPPDGTVAGSHYTIEERNGSLQFGRADRPGESKPISLVLGSGKSGMTYVGDIQGPDLTEFRMSYIPSRRAWYLTPGQEGQANLNVGTVHQGKMARRCLGCHAVALPNDSLELEERFFGVGCESCHGPALSHVKAAQQPNARDLKIERLGNRSPAQINALCATCHRGIENVSLVTREASATARFQPYGLELSPCFRKSGEKMSCLTCHDAHADAETNPRVYDRACLVCHTPATPRHVICPVNPKEKCVGCHMPQRRIFPGSKIPVTMADHLIWAYRAGKKPPSPAPTQPVNE